MKALSESLRCLTAMARTEVFPDPEKRFTGMPPATENLDGHTFRLIRDVTYRVHTGRLAGKTITVRAPFDFDWTTSPRFLWWLYPPTGLPNRPYGWAALIHDWLCEHKAVAGEPVTRAESDAIFFEIIEYVQCGKPMATLMWLGVRAGWLLWGKWRSILKRRVR